MIFSLEALDAKEGDALILHYGVPAEPRWILIDGGTRDVFREHLGPRLNELRDLQPGQPLRLDLLMVSHIDGDHIGGILKLCEKLRDLVDDGMQPFVDVRNLWNNTFDDIAGTETAGTAAVPASFASTALRATAASIQPPSKAMVASVPDGRILRDAAARFNWRVNQTDVLTNAPTTAGGDLIAQPSDGELQVDFDAGLKISVLGPSRERIKEFQKEWDKKLKELRLNQPGAEATVAALVDKSATNLASIVALAECGGRRMLLTGDARADDMLDGMRAAGVLDHDTVQVDILKMPHHGSENNVYPVFFKMVVAKHYVISANGKHHNPDRGTLQMLTEARGDDHYAIHFTNHEGAFDLARKLDDFFMRDRQSNSRHYTVHYRADNAHSLVINLGDDPTVA